MKKSIYKFLVIPALLIVTILQSANAQTSAIEKKTDTVARLAIRYMNTNFPDSVYQLTGEKFKNQIPAATWSTVYNNQLSTLLPFTKIEFVRSIDSVNVYKLTGKVTLTYNAGLDKNNKLVNFSFVPYQE